MQCSAGPGPAGRGAARDLRGGLYEPEIEEIRRRWLTNYLKTFPVEYHRRRSLRIGGADG